MSVKRKRVVIGLVVLILVCLGGSLVLYQLLMPVPLSVLRQIDDDLSNRLRVTRIYSDSSDVFSQLFQTDSEPYSFQIVEAFPIDLEGVGFDPTDPGVGRRFLCISVEVRYETSGSSVTPFGGRTVPETFYYMAYEQDGEWDVFYMLKPSPNCG